MENPPARGGRAAAPETLPKRDGVIAEGTPIVLGDLKVTPVALPGHTPGAMGFIFPVRDGGRTRIAGLFGGTILTPGPISDDNMRIYLKSVAHFKEETRKAKAEIVMANHPLMDPVAPKLARLAARKPGEAHPYVVGEQNYQRFLDVIAACTEVNLARRK
jgi:metallo-beta-lactamase class B